MKWDRVRASALVAVVLLQGCIKMEDLGGRFILYEADEEDIYIGYCFKDCESSSVMVVPPKVVDVALDERWIVARTEGGRSPGYWIIDKGVTVEDCYDCGIADSLRVATRGPLSQTEFATVRREEGIMLYLEE